MLELMALPAARLDSSSNATIFTKAVSR